MDVTNYLNIFEFVSESELANVTSDCKTVFNARSLKSKSEDYSEGATYIIKAVDKPQCNLEHFALSVFKQHTKGMTFDAATSGAEWWTQVIDSRDDIGFHWDRDYGVEEESGRHLYPKFATVTYLSHCGGPTLIMNKSGGDDNKVDITGNITNFIASKPLYGKHIAFDGSLLHAAPSDLLEQNEEDSDDGSGDDEESESEDENDPTAQMRVTLLVNVWVNHLPIQSVRFAKDKRKKLSKSSTDLKISFTNKLIGAETSIALSKVNCPRTMHWEFNNSDVNYVVTTPLPQTSTVEEVFATHHCIEYHYSQPDEVSANISISEDQGSDSGSGSEEGSDEEEEEEVFCQPVTKKARK
jgi:hypothetical protein